MNSTQTSGSLWTVNTLFWILILTLSEKAQQNSSCSLICPSKSPDKNLSVISMILFLCCDNHLLFPEILLLCLLLSWVKTMLSRNTQTTLSAGFSSNWSFKSCSCFVKRYKYISSFQLFTKLFSVLQSVYSQSTKLQILIMMIMITYQTFPKWTKSFLDWAFQEWFISSTGIWIFGKCTVAIWLCSVIGDSNPW